MKSIVGNGNYNLKVFNDKDELVEERQGSNLVLDGFLDMQYDHYAYELIDKLYIGKGTSPSPWNGTNYVDGGAGVLATQNGTTVTTDSSFFNTDMVGNTIHFTSDTYFDGDNYDCKILTFTSDTEVEVNTSVSASLGDPNYESEIVVWNTAKTSLWDAHDDSGTDFGLSHGGVEWPVATILSKNSEPPVVTTTYQAEFQSTKLPYNSTIPGESFQITEFGLTKDGELDTNLMIRVILDTPVTINRNFSFKLVYELDQTYGNVIGSSDGPTDSIFEVFNDTTDTTTNLNKIGQTVHKMPLHALFSQLVNPPFYEYSFTSIDVADESWSGYSWVHYHHLQPCYWNVEWKGQQVSQLYSSPSNPGGFIMHCSNNGIINKEVRVGVSFSIQGTFFNGSNGRNGVGPPTNLPTFVFDPAEREQSAFSKGEGADVTFTDAAYWTRVENVGNNQDWSISFTQNSPLTGGFQASTSYESLKIAHWYAYVKPISPNDTYWAGMVLIEQELDPHLEIVNDFDYLSTNKPISVRIEWNRTLPTTV